MTKHELATLAFKITSIWFILSTLQSLIQSSQFIFDHWTILIALIVLIVLGSGIWFKAEWLADKTIPQDGPLLLSGRFVSRQVMGVALGTIGVVYLIWGLTGAVWLVMGLLFNFNHGIFGESITHTAINFIIGWVLLFGAGRIAKAVLWLRVAGLRSATK